MNLQAGLRGCARDGASREGSEPRARSGNDNAKKAGNIAERTKQKLAEADMQVELAKLNPVEMVEADKDLE